MTHQQGLRLEPTQRQPGLATQPLSDALGFEVTGLDLDALDADTFFAIKDALLDHLVVRIRASNLDLERQVRFARYFGALAMSPESTRRDGAVAFQQFPEVLVVSNIEEQGKPKGELGNFELQWHTDLAFEEVPPSYSFLHAVEVPETGGNTWFCNMYMAYENLSPALRKRVEGLQLKHQNTHSGRGTPRYGFEHISADDVVGLPGPIHPIVRTHPETRRKTIYLGRRFGGYIMGLPVAESEALLDELWAESTRPAHVWSQSWQPGDMVIWDNRCAMHRRDTFPASSRRLMHRVMAVGSKPI